jgi:hypothetical protein
MIIYLINLICIYYTNKKYYLYNMTEKSTNATEIKQIFDENEINDLKRFLKKRQCLNTLNLYMIYLFHFVQSVGLFITSYGTSNNNQILIWIGISLNFLATLIHIYSQTNNSLLKKLMNDINLIKDKKYIDEGELINTESMIPINQQINQQIDQHIDQQIDQHIDQQIAQQIDQQIDKQIQTNQNFSTTPLLEMTTLLDN